MADTFNARKADLSTDAGRAAYAAAKRAACAPAAKAAFSTPQGFNARTAPQATYDAERARLLRHGAR